MSAPYSTLLLDNDANDLCADANGNIAIAAPPYAVAQDVSTAIKTFLGDCYYDQTIGIDYFGKILGKTPPLSVFREAIVNAVLMVPTVVSASLTIESFQNRAISGFVEFTNSDGVLQQVSL